MSNEKENEKQPQQHTEEITATEAASIEAAEQPIPVAGGKKGKSPKTAESNAGKAEKAEVSAASPAKEVVASKAPTVKAESAAKEAPPPPPEPGRYSQLLMANGFSPTPLGKDNAGVEMLELKADELREACRLLRDSSGSLFDLLVSVSGVDWKERLEAVYHLYSTKTFDKLVIKATAKDEKLPSVVPVWQTADWHERETYDLFGIVFEGHPNLKRILMPSDWIGYPLRKDYELKDPRLVWNER